MKQQQRNVGCKGLAFPKPHQSREPKAGNERTKQCACYEQRNALKLSSWGSIHQERRGTLKQGGEGEELNRDQDRTKLLEQRGVDEAVGDRCTFNPGGLNGSMQHHLI
jgi:hypothetical protein